MENPIQLRPPPEGDLSSHEEKMQALTRLVAGLSHDFNNLLTIIDGHATILRYMEALPKDARECVEQIKLAAQRGTGLTRDMLTFGQRQRISGSRFRVSELLFSARDELTQFFGGKTEVVIQSLSIDDLVEADRELLLNALSRIASNARDAIGPAGGIVRLTVETIKISEAEAGRMEDASPGEYVRINFEDNGAGMSPAVLRHAFEPYFTTKPKGAGKGLGLSLVYGVLKLHRGWTEIQSREGQGTTVRLYLPKGAPPPPIAQPDAEKSSGRQSASPPTGEETIFVLEDDENLRLLLAGLLRRLGYTVIEARSFAQARTVWADCHEEVDLVLADLVLPEGRVGMEFAEEIAGDRKDLAIILMSGFAGTQGERDKASKMGFAFIAKPFDLIQLAGLVRMKLDAANACRDIGGPAPT